MSFQQLIFLDSKRIDLLCPKLTYILLSFELFAFIILSLLSNSIKTQSKRFFGVENKNKSLKLPLLLSAEVLVNTDDLIDSASRFEGTTKLPCFFREEDIQIVLAAPDNSFLSRVFNGKIQGNLCTLSKKYDAAEVAKIKRDGFNNFFYFMKRTTLLILLSYLSRDAKQFLVFRKPESYYEMLYTIYVRRSLEATRQISLLERIGRAGESGLFENMFYRIEKDLVSSVMKRIDVYESLEDFVHDYTKIEIVQLENYQKIFGYHAFLLFAFFVVFLATKITLRVFPRIARRITRKIALMIPPKKRARQSKK